MISPRLKMNSCQNQKCESVDLIFFGKYKLYELEREIIRFN
jgi:hypothetical protein